MPFREIAYLEIEHGSATVHSRIPWYPEPFPARPNAPAGAAFFAISTSDGAYSPSDLVDGLENVQFAYHYLERGFYIDAENAYKAVHGAGDSDATIEWRWTVEKGWDDTHDLVLEAKTDGGYFQDATPALWDVTVQDGTFTMSPGSVTQQRANARPLNGRATKCEVKDGTNYVEILPTRPRFDPAPIWVRTAVDVAGDFAALTLDAGGAVETVAQKTVSLETRFDSRLEDLDTVIRFGTDDNGVPIRWRILSTSRGAGGIITLNCSTQVV